MRSIIIILCLLSTTSVIAEPKGDTPPGTELIYNPHTGDLLEVKPEKDGVSISGRNIKTGQTWFKFNKVDGSVYGYDKTGTYIGDRSNQTLQKFPALSSKSLF
jgi:hypothetical protein